MGTGYEGQGAAPLLSLLAPVPQTSTGLPLIKLVGTVEGAVADL
jgi:hypothetical protein